MSLLAEERKKRIIELINNEGQVKVNELAKRFHVSAETIRRHLEELENENKIKKVHGGAVRIEEGLSELSMFKRRILHIDKKMIIGLKAASLVEDGDVIFIDEGSTTLQMANSIKVKSNVTVITNSFPFAVQLMEQEGDKSGFKGKVIFLGGYVKGNHFRTAGSLAEKMAKEFFVDKAFISVDGIDEHAGVTSYDLDKCLLSSIFINNSKQSYVLSDSSKIGRIATYKIQDLEEVDYIITDMTNEGLGIEKSKWIKAN
ncbi:DeoR/GlpR family DNA-binding transcription regulator [Bacillus sp. 1780r2a1]|uniref:DeoR/GlpR family DNA-binding transcription regulator n=1 Tax=Priestia flexa TaxID=86664 RepID=UPI0022088348|nr:DeoR/GlpR family DNA-binding transcription regulator [Priestia flexa]MDT2048573.1 DeoR/GlpR family DNA-binding transcription regulator [Priestia flexa]USY55376.1 DeoR/GlpR family DNA-binding transcription regulator [Bacillus sp. 1780r2a1]